MYIIFLCSFSTKFVMNHSTAAAAFGLLISVYDLQIIAQTVLKKFVELIDVKKQRHQLLQTNCNFIPRFYLPKSYKFVTNFSLVRPNVVAILQEYMIRRLAIG